MEQEEKLYEERLRELFNKAQEKETLKLGRQREKMINYERDLYSNYIKLIETYEKQLEQEFEDRLEKLRQTVATQATDEADRYAKLMSERASYETEIEITLQTVRNQLHTMQQEHETMTAQIAFLKTEKLQHETETQSRTEEEVLIHKQEISKISEELNTKILQKEHEILNLTEQLSSHEREVLVRIEKAKTDMEVQVRAEYQKIQQTFEKSVLDQMNQTRLASYEQDLKERMEFEKEIRTYYEQMISESDHQVREQLTKLFEDHDHKIREQRKHAEEQTRQLIERMLKEQQETQISQDETRQQFVRTIRDQYEKILTEQKLKIDQLQRQQEEKRVADITQEETKTHLQLTLEAQLQTKYDTLLKKQKEHLLSRIYATVILLLPQT